MAMCEDFPCCGHEAGCCPDFDESGKQLNMKCVCGATVPLTSRSSLCQSCLNAPDPDDPYGDERDYGTDPADYYEQEYYDAGTDF